jgi:hypothetical protein
MTVGRSGSTALMESLHQNDNIALPSRDTDCEDDELLHPEHVARYMQDYSRLCGCAVADPQALIETFYRHHDTSPYAGFKSMPDRHPDFAAFVSRPDIRFIGLIRRDIPSTVASFLVALEKSTWRRHGEPYPEKWKFDRERHGKVAQGNLAYILNGHSALMTMPNVIRLTYEDLCAPGFRNQQLEEFFGREIRIENPRPPTHGSSYVENWEEFVAFLRDSATAMRNAGGGKAKPAARLAQTAKSSPASRQRRPVAEFQNPQVLCRAMADHHPVFVCGLPRSGTSLLFQCLREHPAISGFRDTGVPEDEGQHLQSVYPSGRVHGGPGRFGFDPAAFLDERSPLATPAHAQKLFSEWSAYWDLDKPVLLEKSPPNLIRTRYLQALFPNASFIVLLRHPLAVSLATQKWSKAPIQSLLEHSLICTERFDLDRRHLQRVFILKYEDFVHRPQAMMDDIYAFIGLESVPLGQEVRTDVNNKYFQRWHEMLPGFYKKEGMKRYFEHIIESRVMRFGYSMIDLDRHDPYPEII